MEKTIRNILEHAKVAYKESIMIGNDLLEDQLLSIIGDSKLLLNELKKNHHEEPKMKTQSEIEADEIKKVQKRIPLWLTRRHQKNYKILASFMILSKNNQNPVAVSLLEKYTGITSREFISHYNQMKIFAEKAHGKIFVEEDGQVRLWESISDFVIDTFQLTLHEAIKVILEEKGHPMNTLEIADELNKKEFYHRKDKDKIPPSQVSARVNKYPDLFLKSNDKIGLSSIYDQAIKHD